ncbi:hypothetical protein HK097_003619 [Rhizophlyctis rosea]|uniref:Mannan endo-1,4-beta-mannosidase n=1 Tax=Rhizophlyctis rosea TaxID=64517 RepID=A0AAD5SHX9_9FUNG|nr:hypothetical protein HK097_003619 [Rhizophlyctis rosea]
MGNHKLAFSALAILATQALAQDAQTTVIDNGLASGWDNWGWSTAGFETQYTGAPAAPSGKAVVKGTVDQWGAIALHNGNNVFAGAKTLKVKIAADAVPNFNVYLQGDSESSKQNTRDNCAPWVAGQYADCTFDLSKLDGTWNRLNFQNTDSANTIYLADAVLSGTPQPPYVVPDTYPTYPANEEWCQDVAPSKDYTCAQQASWGKCNLTENPWMNGFCTKTCGACPSYAPRNQTWKLSTSLYDRNANRVTKQLYDALKFAFGRKVLSGQAEQADTSLDRDGEFKYLKNLTGATPAVRLMDFIFYVGDPAFEDGSIDRAIDWYHNKSGIVQYQWHWRAPKGVSDFYTAKTDFDITKAVTEGTEEYNLAIRDIGVVIQKMKLLEKAGVPVIFRPLHEPNGGWFWWGAKGPAPYLKLWDIIQREFTTAKVHNVIWLHNFAGAPDEAWYPGNNKVDMVSTDRYSAPGTYDVYPSDFFRLKYITGASKIQVMGENGPLPDADLMVQTGALWGYFATWNGDYIMNNKQNSEKEIVKVFQHDVVFNLEDIQSLVEMGVSPFAPKDRNPKITRALAQGKALLKLVRYLADVAGDLAKYLLGQF